MTDPCLKCVHLQRSKIKPFEPMDINNSRNFCGHSLLVESKPIPLHMIVDKQTPEWCPDVKQLKLELK